MDHSAYVGKLTREETEELAQEAIGQLQPDEVAKAIYVEMGEDFAREVIAHLEDVLKPA